jgi:DNA polymerase-1
MPEDLAAAIPLMKRLCEAMRVPLLIMDGYEADDIIGTVAHQAEKEGFETWMVTPDKDFGQLVTELTRIYKPGNKGGEVERIGVAEVLQRWGIERTAQVIDVLALMGDASDNIPGIKGVGEKTAVSLIQQFGSVEGVLENADKIKGKTGEKVTEGREMAILSKRLVTIFIDAPVGVTIDDLVKREFDAESLKTLMVELEFNGLGKRLFGDDFRAGRGEGRRQVAAESTVTTAEAAPSTPLKTLADVPHDYRLIRTAEERRHFLAVLAEQPSFCFDLETTGLDPRDAEIIGIAFSWQAGTGCFVRFADHGESVRRWRRPGWGSSNGVVLRRHNPPRAERWRTSARSSRDLTSRRSDTT